MSGGKDLAQRVDTIIDCINRECDGVNSFERTMVLLYVREAVDSVVHMDFVDAVSQRRESEAIAKYEAENMKLRMLLEGQKVCSDEEADAHDCPLYDEREPYRCAKERLMQELGIGE